MAFDALYKTQSSVAESLESVLSRSMLPRTLLFSGARGSSRLTAALDLAFYLTACEEREMLRGRNIVLFLSRPMHPELRAASLLFQNQLTKRSRIFYIQSVRKILLQYHQCIAELHREASGIKGKKDDRLEGDRSVSAVASYIDELLFSLEDDREYSESEVKKIVREIDSCLTDPVINVGKKTQGATIEEIRSIQSWLSEGSDEKVVIFENAEDYTEGAKNSLLKLLEEPPQHAHLILISKCPGRLLETILSRCRKFTFPELTEEKVCSFIADTFSIYDRYSSFDEFFFAEGADEDEKKAMEDYVGKYVYALSNGVMMKREEEEAVFSGLEKLGGYEYFRERVLSRLEGLLRSGCIKGTKAKRIYEAFSSSLLSSDTYNMSMRMALDLAMREVRHVE